MHILVDIGNTNILFGKFDNLNLVEQLRIETKVFDKDISKVDSETYKKIHDFIGNDCSDFFSILSYGSIVKALIDADTRFVLGSIFVILTLSF